MNEVENEFIRFWIEDGLLMSEIKENKHIVLNDISDLINLRHQISNNEHQCWCMDATNILSMSKEARVYTEKHGQELLYSCAVLINSHVGKALYNSYNKFNPPKIPFVFFTKKEKAVEWLLTFKQELELA